MHDTLAILLLADEGKLSLADPVTRFFPDFPSKYKAVQVAHLVAHTSGLPNYTIPLPRSVLYKADNQANLDAIRRPGY